MANTTKSKGNNQSDNSEFVKQAGILAAAGIISRLIGLLYRVPLANILTDEGNGYYSTAYNVYTIVLLLSSYSIPSAISKLMAGKLEQRQYKNAQRIFYCALIYVGAIGFVAALVLYFGANVLVNGNASVVLRVFAPTVFIYGFLGVLRGYFQAHKTMVATSVSQIFEQILNAIVSLAAASAFMRIYQEPQYGAMGSAIGTGAGVVTALLFMLFVYMVNRKRIRARVKNDRGHYDDPTGEIFKSLLLIVTPIILSTFIYNFNITLNNRIFTEIAINVKGMAQEEAYSVFGIYSGKAVLLSDVPIAVASAMSAALIPVISTSFVRDGKKTAGGQVEVAVQTTMLICIPCAVGLFVLAEPILTLLFGFSSAEDLAMAVILLRMMCLSTCFYALSTVSNGILQGIGLVNKPVKNAAIALACQTVLVVVLMYVTNLGIYTLPIAYFFYAGLMSLLNQRDVGRALDCHIDFVKVYAKPGLSALIMGVAAYFVYHGIYFLLPSNILCLALAMLFAVVVYLVLLVVTGGLTVQTLYNIPKGYLLIPVLRKIGLKDE
ncbi:MAG: polysaccharide biosynthesis protein [Lachnospiraceae bacterium]|nr:polysaccharide biosynthesis protein [Lachnospiraceae bacterium]